jgi:uncharacterized protein
MDDQHHEQCSVAFDWQAVSIAMPDDVMLAGALFLPQGVVGDSQPHPHPRIPVVLEYLPYRLADYTSIRDHRRHPYFVSNGIAVARVDIRGSGNSEGYERNRESNSITCLIQVMLS